jgi:hypothetical protein
MLTCYVLFTMPVSFGLAYSIGSKDYFRLHAQRGIALFLTLYAGIGRWGNKYILVHEGRQKLTRSVGGTLLFLKECVTRPNRGQAW